MPDYTAYLMRLNRMTAVFPRLVESLIHKYEADGEVPVNLIALVASYMQFTCIGECPKTANGTPMCYYSLALFMSLIVLKVMFLRLK